MIRRQTNGYGKYYEYTARIIYFNFRLSGNKILYEYRLIDGTMKNKRSKALIQLKEKLQKIFLEKFIGKELKVLFETEQEINGKTYYVGHTMNYVKVGVIRGNSELINLIHHAA